MTRLSKAPGSGTTALVPAAAPAARPKLGSAHSGGWLTSWCDGHVELVSYDVDLQVHRANANRADDGLPNTTPPKCPGGGI
jgi:hypothetical protein